MSWILWLFKVPVMGLWTLITEEDDADEDEDDIETSNLSQFLEELEHDLEILEEDYNDFEEEDVGNFNYDLPRLDNFDNEEIFEVEEHEEAKNSIRLKKKTMNFGDENLKVNKTQMKSYNESKNNQWPQGKYQE